MPVSYAPIVKESRAPAPIGVDLSPQEWWTRAAAELDWLPGRRLNIAHEAVDRHAHGPDADRVAYRFLSKGGGDKDLTYADLLASTNRFANILGTLGVERGDIVCTLAGRIPELYVAALGAMKHGSVYSPLFAAFGPEPVRTRLAIARARVLVTTRAAYMRKVEPMRSQLPDLEHVILVGDPAETAGTPGTLDYHALDADASDVFQTVPMRPDDVALVHFTSGTTGTQGRRPRARGGGRAFGHREGRARPAPRRRVLVHGRPRVGDGDVLRHRRATHERRDEHRRRG